MRKLVFLRRFSQTLFLILFIYILWSTTYPLKGIISSQVLFKIDPLIVFLTALSERRFIAGIIFSAIMVFMTFFLGRFFCGWVCPMGTMIDGAGALIRRRRKNLSYSEKRKISLPKFFVLGGITLFALIGIQTAWVLDPIVTAARVISLNLIPGVTLAVDKTFQFLIQRLGFYGGVYDFYRSLKSGLLGINAHFFANSLTTLIFFLVICFCSVLILRLWCRMLCPLGALYALNAGSALLKRQVKKCTSCGVCVKRCRMGAIKEGTGYHQGECILCMDCVYNCPEKSTEFSWERKDGPGRNPNNEKGITRGQFLIWLGAVISFSWLKTGRLFAADYAARSGHPVIRPPGALAEGQFVNACVRCGNCMKVCVTNGLQPVALESGLEGLWTPQLVPEIGYCEYNCTLCGEVCPTGAIPQLALSDKKKQRLGLAEIDRSLCFAWIGNKECIVCEEHCPISEKAIKSDEAMVLGKKIFRPVVDPNLCVGCGICQNKCPVLPTRAIRVNPRKV